MIVYYVLKTDNDKVFIWSQDEGVEVFSLEELQLIRQVKIKGKRNMTSRMALMPVKSFDCGDMYVKELITTSQGARACIVASNLTPGTRRMSRSELKRFIEDSGRKVHGVIISDKGVGLKVVEPPPVVGAELL